MMNRLPVLAFLLTSALVGACAEAEVPSGLVGTWATSAASHADRTFRITPDSLFLDSGPGVQQAYRITSVKRYGWAGGGGIRIDYERGDLANTLRLEMNSDSAFVRLANRREIIWRRLSTSTP